MLTSINQSIAGTDFELLKIHDNTYRPFGAALNIFHGAPSHWRER